MAEVRAVIFDIDGTLIDSRELIYRAMEDVLAARGVKVTREEIDTTAGKPIQAMYTMLAPHLDPAELEAAHLAHHEEHSDLLKLYDRTHEVLQLLKDQGYTLGVFTGFNKITHERLKRFDIAKYFSSVVESTMYTAHKPDPEGLFLSMDELGIDDPATVVYIGDGAVDMQVGRNAGVGMTVGITHGFGTRQILEECGADHTVDSLPGFKSLLARTNYNTLRSAD